MWCGHTSDLWSVCGLCDTQKVLVRSLWWVENVVAVYLWSSAACLRQPTVQTVSLHPHPPSLLHDSWSVHTFALVLYGYTLWFIKKTWQSITVHQIFIDFDIIALPLPEHVMRVESQLCIAHLLNYFLTSSCQWRHQSVIFVTMFITVSVFHFYQVVFAHI